MKLLDLILLVLFCSLIIAISFLALEILQIFQWKVFWKIFLFFLKDVLQLFLEEWVRSILVDNFLDWQFHQILIDFDSFLRLAHSERTNLFGGRRRIWWICKVILFIFISNFDKFEGFAGHESSIFCYIIIKLAILSINNVPKCTYPQILILDESSFFEID